uniref:Uncharacterized protein n=1 Tax=Arundo donax TaxID=35708 RepID=A0A0A9FY29_ARUDO
MQKRNMKMARDKVPLPPFRKKAYCPNSTPQSLPFLSYPTIIKQYHQLPSAAHNQDSDCIIGGKRSVPLTV